MVTIELGRGSAMGLGPRARAIRIGIWGIFFTVMDLILKRIIKPYVGRVRRWVQGRPGFSVWVLGVEGLTACFVLFFLWGGGFRVQRLA